MRWLALFLLFIFSAYFADGQSALEKKQKRFQKRIEDKKKRTPFLSMNVKSPKKSLSVFGQASTIGYALGIQYEKKHNKRYNTFSIFFSEIKSDKEEKFRPTNLEVKPFGKPKPYIYGKENSFYNLNITVGRRNILYKGLLSPSIDISVNYYGGLSLGALKPYALKLKYPLPNNRIDIREEVYSSTNQDLFLNKSVIYSRTKFNHTINDISLVPGLILGGSIDAEVGKHPAFVKRVQIGGQLYGYTKKINILIREDSKAFYYNAFVGLSIGKRW